MKSKSDVVRHYFHLLEEFATDEESFSSFMHPEFQQRELPNILNRNGQTSDFADLLRRAAQGKGMLTCQTYDISNIIESGDHVVVEALWKGTLAVNAGVLSAGQEMKAHFCVVLEFKDGKLHRQRNYDCFEPF